MSDTLKSLILVVLTLSPATMGTSKGTVWTAFQKQVTELKYPEYPNTLKNQISGTSSSAPQAATEEPIAAEQEWGLTSIGFFDVIGQLTPEKNTLHCPQPTVVAVIDTGVDYTHPRLQDSLWVNRGETGAWVPPKGYSGSCRDKSCNGVDDDANGYADDVIGWDFVHDVPLPFDTHGHGTHIAGIIAASSANGRITSCPRVALMALKYYDNGGAGYNNLANTVRAIEYAIHNGAQIINYSGGGNDPAATERAAVANAQRKGILFVAAAGNDGRNNDSRPYFPASYPVDNLISVASVNKYERLLPSSNFGRSVHVAAPGLMILSTMPGGKYGTMSGTSQATAFVTGAAALISSEMGSVGFDYRKVKKWILEGTKSMKLNNSKQLLAAGLLSIPGSLNIERTYLAKTVGSRPTSTEIAAALPAGQASKSAPKTVR